VSCVTSRRKVCQADSQGTPSSRTGGGTELGNPGHLIRVSTNESPHTSLHTQSPPLLAATHSPASLQSSLHGIPSPSHLGEVHVGHIGHAKDRHLHNTAVGAHNRPLGALQLAWMRARPAAGAPPSALPHATRPRVRERRLPGSHPPCQGRMPLKRSSVQHAHAQPSRHTRIASATAPAAAPVTEHLASHRTSQLASHLVPHRLPPHPHCSPPATP
jgi:hypothetical protein